jgi:hypothetical protein
MHNATDVVDGEFGGFVAAALTAVSPMPPGPDQTSVRRVQIDGETLSLRIELEIRVRPPLGGHQPIGDFHTLQDATELLLLSVEDPSAVARFQDHGVHDSTIALPAEPQRRRTWRPPEDFIAVG